MDPALRREHEAFKKRALNLPSVEAKPKKSSAASESSKPKAAKKPRVEQTKSHELDYKAVTGYSDNKFAILAKVVKHLRTRHQDGETEAISLDDILDETDLVLTARLRYWLTTEALLNNPKIEVVDQTTFKFKPIYNIRDRKGLLQLLIRHDQQGLGGVLADDAEESLPNFNKAIKVLGDQIVIVTRPIDKKQVLFYNDRAAAFTVDEEIQKLWRSVTVEGVDERKIEEYLQKHNIVAMQDLEVRKSTAQRRKNMGKKKLKPFKTKDNAHVGDILKDYSAK